MASFTDQAPQFKEYVSQMPLVEAMVNVGTQKQAAYDQGYQKIQSHIDQIGGLDIMRDADKQYLQSKLNQLNTNLRGVAAGDFSNYQLVNSVGGMITKVGKDKNVQTAVSSTATYRKETARIQEDIDSGKFNPNNIKKFHKDTKDWLSSITPGEALPTRYIPPVDVWGKIKDIAKEVGIDEQTVQQLYETDAQGNPQYNYDEKGNPVSLKFNNIMVEKHLKGKDAGKLLTAFKNALTAADYQQLAIDGEFNKAHETPEQLIQQITENSSNQIGFADKKLVYLKTALVNENASNKKDQEKINSITSQIEYFEKYKKELESGVEKNIQAVYTNPDAVRSSLYTNNFLHSMSKVLSSQEESTKFSVNPNFTISMELNKFNRETERDKVKNDQWQLAHNLNKDKFEWQKKQDKIKNENEYGVDEDGKSVGVTGAVSAEELATRRRLQIEEDFDNILYSYNDTNNKIALEYFKSLPENVRKEGESDIQYEDRIKKEMYSKLSGSVLNPDSGDINQKVEEFATMQLSAWAEDPTKIPNKMVGLMKLQDERLKQLNLQKKEIERVNEKAEIIAKERGVDYKKIEEIKQSISPTTIKLMSAPTFGQTSPIFTEVDLSKNDMIDLVYARPDMLNILGKITIDPGQKLERDRALTRLTAKYGKGTVDRLLSTIYKITERGQFVAPEIQKVINLIKENDFAATEKIKEEIYQSDYLLRQPINYSVVKGKMNEADFRTNIYNVLQSRGEALSEKQIEELILKDKTGEMKAFTVSAQPSLSLFGGTTYYFNLSSPSIGKKTFEITKEEAQSLGVNPADAAPIPMVVNKLTSSKTSNDSGGEDPRTAWYKSDTFQNFKSDEYQLIAADYDVDLADPNKVWLKFYAKDLKTNEKLTPKTYPIPFYIRNEKGEINNQLDIIPSKFTEEGFKSLMKK